LAGRREKAHHRVVLGDVDGQAILLHVLLLSFEPGLRGSAPAFRSQSCWLMRARAPQSETGWQKERRAAA
jgi:hypothetical protein